MNHQHVKYLLAGGGVASSSAVEAIREVDREGSILLVGQDVMRPYHRPPLSKGYLQRRKTRADLFVKELGWYERNGVELRTGRRVEHLDVVRMAATMSTGESISFDRLLLATGSTPIPLRLPGGDLPNIFQLRTIHDCEVIHHAIDIALRDGRTHAKGRGRAVVIGGGLLGLEVAASLTQLGLGVDLSLSHAHPWETLVGDNVGRFLVQYLERHGVTVHASAPARRLEGDGRVQRVLLADGVTLNCDIAIAAVGAVPNKDLLHATPISAGRAILTDVHCETNVQGVFAAGDCAAVFDPLFGRHRVIDHWENATLTGRIAGHNMAGKSESYSAVNHFTTECFDLKLDVWGDARSIDHRLLRGLPTGDQADFAELGVDATGRIVQVVAAGRTHEHASLDELVADRRNANGIEEALKDPQADLGGVL
jgi:3-phenylpropionate/trans-cinnamate dioxygenase ferredoxin reductase subunit